MIKRLVAFGGVLGILASGCGGKGPSLNINPVESNMYIGYKGDVSRAGFLDIDAGDMLSPLWQIKFRYPLYYSPSLAGDYIFQPGVDKKIHVIDINTGVELAEIKVRRPIGATPEMADSFMAVCEEGERSEILVFNYLSGRMIWSARTYRLCLPPALYNNKIFWVDGNNTLNAARLYDGVKSWSLKFDSRFDCGPVLGDSLIFVATADSLLYAIDPVKGAITWKTGGVGRTNSSPAYFGGCLYICDAGGKVAAYDAASGRKLWSHDDDTRLFYSPSVDDEGVYYGSGDGRFSKLNRTNGRVIWEFETGSPVRGTALVTTDIVVFWSLDYTVHILEKDTGRQVMSYVATGMISAAPVMFDNRLLIAAQDKYLYCFLMKEGN